MKKWICGLVWQALGFLGAILVLCTAATQRWDYNGIEGIVGSLLGLELTIPLFVCIVIFIVGSVFLYKGLREK